MFTSFCLFTFVLFALEGKTHGGEEYNCADIRFLNQHDDVIYLNLNDYINITFAIDWVNCSFATSGRFLKVVAKTTEQAEDKCKIILMKGTCSISDTSPCFCMIPDGPITFYKRITKPVNRTYQWLWYHGDEAKEKIVTVKILDVPLEVRTCCDTEDDSPRPGVVVAVVVGTCCVLAVVALVIILFVRKKGSRVTADGTQSETHIYSHDGVECQDEVYTEFTWHTHTHWHMQISLSLLLAVFFFLFIHSMVL